MFKKCQTFWQAVYSRAALEVTTHPIHQSATVEKIIDIIWHLKTASALLSLYVLILYRPGPAPAPLEKSPKNAGKQLSRRDQ